jgi:hypothetical protein
MDLSVGVLFSLLRGLTNEFIATTEDGTFHAGAYAVDSDAHATSTTRI